MGVALDVKDDKKPIQLADLANSGHQWFNHLDTMGAKS